MGRPPTPLHWRLAAPPTELDTLLDQLAVQGQAFTMTLTRAVVLLTERVEQLEGQLQRASVEAEYLTPKAAALKFGLHRKTIARWCREQRVDSIGSGNGRRVKLADIATLARYRAGPQDARQGVRGRDADASRPPNSGRRES